MMMMIAMDDDNAIKDHEVSGKVSSLELKYTLP
jgi:hypothetical protein